MPLDNPTNKGALAGNQYRFGGNYAPGTAPTLLSSVEARKVVGFIENIVYNSLTFIKTGSPNKNGFWLDFTDPGRVGFWLQIQTDLFFDKTPKLGADLLINGFNIVADSSYSYFRQYSDYGLQVISGPTYTGSIRLGTDPVYTFQKFIGFKAPAQATADVVWTLPNVDGAANQFLKTNGSKVLSWGASSSSVTVTPSATINVVNVGDDYTPHLMGLEAETLVGRAGQYLRVRNDEAGFEFVSCPICVMGACCVEGVCEQTVEIDCVDTWLSGVECTPGLCTEGTCCVGETCTFTVESLCDGLWVEGGSCSPNPCALGACCVEGVCEQTTEINCVDTWLEGVACDPNPCVEGTCCDAGVCTFTVEANCSATWSSGGSCSPNPCALGACCVEGVCEQTTEINCADTWLEGVACDPNPCAEGTCCDAGVCTFTVEANCSATWSSGGSCSPNPCPSYGACCEAGQSGGPCTQVTESECDSIGGYWSLGVLCGEGSQECNDWGACCYHVPYWSPSGEVLCGITNQSYCEGQYGTYYPWTLCGSVDCADASGTCCTPSFECTDTFQYACLGLSTWTANQNCIANPCPAPTGSCCAPNGDCSVTTDADCDYTWSSGGVCSPNTCTQPSGSCCAPNGDCSVTTDADCDYTWSSGGVCSPNTCTQPTGSCCVPYSLSGCFSTTESSCTVFGGIWTEGGSCTPDPCSTGACCFYGGGGCLVLSSGDCTIMGGTYFGGGSTCAGVGC